MPRITFMLLFGSLVGLLSTLSACAGAVDTIRQPLVAGTIDRNEVIEPHHFAERANRLPQGAMSDAARLTKLGDSVCFDVVMHELDVIDLAKAHAVLAARGQQPLARPELRMSETKESTAGATPLYESHAQLCFPNQGYVTASTRGLELDVTVARHQVREDVLDGPAEKHARFVWRFSEPKKL